MSNYQIKSQFVSRAWSYLAKGYLNAGEQQELRSYLKELPSGGFFYRATHSKEDVADAKENGRKAALRELVAMGYPNAAKLLRNAPGELEYAFPKQSHGKTSGQKIWESVYGTTPLDQQAPRDWQ